MEFGGSWSSFLCTYSTVAQICCTCAVKKKHTQGGPRAQEGMKGHAPRAQEGHSSTGISRPRTKVRRTRAYFSAANTLLRSRASRGHLNLFHLNGIWWFVGGRRFFMYLRTYSTVQYSTVQYSTVQYSTVLLYMCSKQEHKVDHGHKKGHAPRAQEGRSPTGISRPRTEVLRTQKPRIARAPELVRLKSRLFRENREMRETG